MKTQPLHIAMATNRFAPSTGGIETHVARLSRHLVEAGHQVTVLTHDHWGDLPMTDEQDGVKIIRFAPLVRSRHLAVSPALGRHLSEHPLGYDVVHAHGYHDTPAAMAAIAWHGPLVFTPHYHGSSESKLRSLLHLPYRLIGRRIFKRADRVICVSGAESEHINQRFPDTFDKTEVISNGVDRERLQAAPISQEPDGRTILLVAGRLDHYKQVDRVVKAMTALRGDFVLKITGDGPARAYLAELVRTHELEDSVHLLGRVPDETLASLFRSAGCLISMSTHEAQGIVLLEALSVGTRTVASAIPAHVDVGRMANGAVTLVATDSSPRTLADAIGQACRQSRPDVFIPGWAEVALQTELLYHRVIDTHDPEAIDVSPGESSWTEESGEGSTATADQA